MRKSGKVFFLVLSIITFLIIVPTAFAEIVVRHPVGRTPDDTRYQYMTKLLILLLDKTVSTHGAYSLEGYLPMTQDRIIREILVGRLDVAQLPISSKANEILLPVKIPIRKGLLGWRILLIHQDNISKFKEIKTLSDLRKFRAGFGSQWGDLPVLKHNVGTVITDNEYEGLFRLLAGKYFDYLHRGIHEPWNEIEARKDRYPELRIEKTLVIHYPMGNYLYVSKENMRLFNRLSEGFGLALEDGSFETLFNTEYGAIINRASIRSRTPIFFENPFLPEDTPENKKLWLRFF